LTKTLRGQFTFYYPIKKTFYVSKLNREKGLCKKTAQAFENEQVEK
jgi:hypothetical protein